MATPPFNPSDPKRRLRTRPSRNLNRKPARGYHPSANGIAAWWGYGSSSLDNKPVFRYWDVPRMLRDPIVEFGLNMLVGPLTTAEWDIKAKNPEVGNFVKNTVDKFWRHLMPIVAYNYFAWGSGPAVHDFDIQASGQAVYAGGRWVMPSDASPRVWTESGEFAGFDLTGGSAESGRSSFVGLPWAYWMGGNERAARFYDHPRCRGAFEPWLEKNTRKGGLHARKLYFFNNAFKGVAIYHPIGKLDPSDPNSPDNSAYAQHLLDLSENGTNYAFPDDRVPGDERKESSWRIQPIDNKNGSAVEILDYIKELDGEVLKGLGIPPELVEAAETGSGWSGRMIPMQSFFTSQTQVLYHLWNGFEPTVRELVNHNYDGEEFTCEPVPLLETVLKQNGANPTSSVGGPPGQPGQPQVGTDAQMAGSGDATGGGGAAAQKSSAGGGGDPTAGGLVPYVGPKGGRGKRNPVTGQVYYMSQDGRRVGCLMAELPKSFADACLAFAKSIPANELAEDGLELWPHVTLFHGLHSLDPSPVFNATAPLGSLKVVPGKLGMFEGDGHDVLYVTVDNAADCGRWNRAASGLPNTPSDHGYVPHITLAYLKPGKGKQYLGRDDLSGGPVAVETVVYATPDGREARSAVWPSEEELEASLSAAVGC